MLVGAVLSASLGMAQSNTEKAAAAPPPPAPKPVAKAAPAQELDQGESLLYIGRKLWFETRKRLNLASEEEVEAQAEEEKKVKLRVGSFKIER